MPPRRTYQTRGSTPSEVGAEGEAAIGMLASEQVVSPKSERLEKLRAWLISLGLASDLKLDRLATSDNFDFSLALPDGAALPIADLGYGVSQVLPVLVQCVFSEKGNTLLFEQPEIHLHPACTTKLLDVFIETALVKRARIIVETHQKEFFPALLHQINAGKISVDDVAVYKVSRKNGATEFKKIPFEKREDGFCYGESWADVLTEGMIGPKIT